MGKREKNQSTPVDYEVGYGRPPKHTRWEKGQSGNKKGRPKNVELDFPASVAKMLGEQFTISNNGKDVRLPKMRVFVDAMFKHAVMGNTAAQRQIVQAHSEHVSRGVAAPPTEIDPTIIEVTLILEDPQPANPVQIQYRPPPPKDPE